MTTTQTKNAETRMNTGFQHKQQRYETWTSQKECSDLIPSFNLVRATGLEPVRHKHTPLKRACLPVPARSHFSQRQLLYHFRYTLSIIFQS